jgi:hypothetical protein
MENAGTPMPKYKCHKEVFALKIAAIEILEDGSARVAPADGKFATFTTKPKFPFKGAAAGNYDDPGYFVAYSDGYQSWSPTKAFEEGYTLI